MMFFKNFIKKFASQYSKLQLYEIILKKRITFLEKKYADCMIYNHITIVLPSLFHFRGFSIM